MPSKKITVTQYECSRCGYTWVPRKAQPPKVCPECKNTNWDAPRQGQPK
jgi:predicted Zn-ribbon and HTH transcriptional regulator